MRKILILLVSFTIVAAGAMNLSAEKTDIEMRAFKDGKFLKDLAKGDFEIYYDNNKVSLKNISLIEKKSVSKVLGKKIKKKGLNRNFVLIFSMRNMSSKIFDAIDYFFKDVILPGDSLTIFTPKKNYNLKSQTLKRMSKQKIAGQLKGLLNRDINVANQRYMSLLDNLIKTVKGMSSNSGEGAASSVEMALPRFREDLIALENLRHIQQKQIVDLVLNAGKRKGQNLVFLFYDREFIPSPTMKELRNFKLAYKGRQDVINNISSLFEFYKRDLIFEKKNIKNKLKNLNVLINPIFFKEDSVSKSNSNLVEHSEDMFALFTLMSDFTGAKFDNSSNLFTAFKNAVNYSESFYRVGFELEKKEKLKKEELKIKTKDSKVKVFYRIVNN